ncbi:MAG: flavodoxin family protein [Methylocystis sp.]
MASKRLLIVAHAPSPNTERLRDALIAGARSPDIEEVEVTALGPFGTTPAEVLSADAIILGATEDLGYMSGALKDFFDRCYCPCLGRTEGMPYAFYIRAGNDGTGAKRGVETIVTGLRWRKIQEPLIFRGAWREEFVAECRELGTLMAAGLEAGVF